MSIDEQQMRAIAFLAARCRPTGSKPWDEAGIVANLRKVAHLDAAEVVIATIRAAANRQAESPGVIPHLGGEHWREKVTEKGRAVPPKRDEQCRRCGSFKGNCACQQESRAWDADENRGDAMSKDDALALAREALR